MLAQLFCSLNSRLDPLPTGLDAHLPKLGSIKSVIFDIYGTLVLSGTGDISIAQTIDRETELRSILAPYGLQDPEDKNLSGLFYGFIKEDHAHSRAKGDLYPEVDIFEIWARFFEATVNTVPTEGELAEIAVRFECAVNPVWPMPKLDETLNALRDKAIPIGIVSNAQFYTPIMLEGFTGHSLEELGFEEDLSIWSYREHLGKPSVELFEKLNQALAARGIASGESLYVGNDMLNDIWTANQAGLQTALFAGDQRSLRLRETDERCKDLIPDVILTELPQLLEVI